MINDFIKDFAKYIPAQFVPALVGLITIPIVTRLFSPADYGNYVLVTATVSILTTIAVGWLDNSIIRFYPAYELRGELSYFYNSVLGMTLVSVAAIFVIFLGILSLGQVHISASLCSLMRLGGLVFIVTSFFQVLQTFLRAKRQVQWYTSFALWHSVAKVGLGITLIFMWNMGIEGLLWGSVISIVIAMPLLYWFSVGKGTSVKVGISLPMVSEMAKYGFPLVVSFLASWIMSFSDRYILGLFRSSQEVGIYSASYGIAEQTIFMLSSLFIMASGPLSMNVWEKQGVEKSKEFLIKLTRYWIIIGLPATVGLSILARSIINIMAAPEYYRGFQIIPLVSFGAFLSALGGRYATPFMWYNKTKLLAACTGVSCLLNVGLNFLLIPMYGYMAAAVTTFISSAVGFLFGIFVSRKFFIWKFPFKTLVKVACASIVMGAAIYPLGNNLTSSPLINLCVSIPAGVGVYFLSLVALKGFEANEIEALLAWRRKVIKR
ncbi:MAG TPA: hypothetical protein DEG96_09920 [Candidatus Atribacteria bacterium]|uniref:Polysaccharide biosynthesis family protein n=1 Tax=candidate division TA06 bacterium 34_109 TaxID=1635277 RepID=A0A101HZX5_UNCT6|nr:MAG: Polysaccharide biosynthesis family protein [candidate division TA06 bacterium 34_109]HBY58150.1 hypothetical protein [Candidatus Atribacteria bacterium]